MKSFFKNHPIISYNGLQLRNILLKAQLTKQVLQNLESATLFLPYTVNEGETPTTVAYDYYGHIDYTWLVLFSINATDPYTAWVKTQEQFDAYIAKKYGSLQNAFNQIHHYQHNTDPDLPPATPTTYAYLTPVEQGQYSPVLAYDHELQVNESKRQIQLVDKVYAARISLELEKKLKP